MRGNNDGKTNGTFTKWLRKTKISAQIYDESIDALAPSLRTVASYGEVMKLGKLSTSVMR